MIEANRAHIYDISSSINDFSYEIKTGGWISQVTDYEKRWRESSGILPTLEWQLQKRKREGWELWDMPLMKPDIGSERFLYDRM